MGLLKKLFGMRKSLLYPLPNIYLSYKCQCGESCTFHCQDVDPEHGADVFCPNCAAKTFVPPTIFDRTRPFYSEPSGAYIYEDWYMRLQPPRPF